MGTYIAQYLMHDTADETEHHCGTQAGYDAMKHHSGTLIDDAMMMDCEDDYAPATNVTLERQHSRRALVQSCARDLEGLYWHVDRETVFQQTMDTRQSQSDPLDDSWIAQSQARTH